MKPDRIKISERFNENLWLTMEAPIAPEENVIEQFKNTRQLLLDAYKEMGEPKLYDVNDVLPVVKERSRSEIIAAHLQTINECKTLRNLEMFANMVQRENEDVLYEAYHQKKNELSK